jgi:hypothetical protein
MCIIAYEVESVNNTKIFVAPDKDYKLQYTVYSNQVDNKIENNVMILPVPYPKSVKFIEIGKDFFEKCDLCFNRVVLKSDARYRSMSDSHKKLKVHSVGSYLASIAEDCSQIENADHSVFDIPDNVCELLKGYPAHYGFIICKLDNNTKEYHPFGYSHQLDDILFIPTMHYHGHKTLIEKYDHTIYMYNSSSNYVCLASKQTSKMEFEVNKLISFKYSKFNLGDYNNFEKYVIKGLYQNQDFFGNKIGIYQSQENVQNVSQVKNKQSCVIN